MTPGAETIANLCLTRKLASFYDCPQETYGRQIDLVEAHRSLAARVPSIRTHNPHAHSPGGADFFPALVAPPVPIVRQPVSHIIPRPLSAAICAPVLLQSWGKSARVSQIQRKNGSCTAICQNRPRTIHRARQRPFPLVLYAQRTHTMHKRGKKSRTTEC